MSRFKKWFVEQHGPRSLTASATDEELRDRIKAGSFAASEMQRRALWDKMFASALYAWQIKDTDKAPVPTVRRGRG